MLPVTGVVVVVAKTGELTARLRATTKPRSVPEGPMLIIQ
jgi:hypothetical protein